MHLCFTVECITFGLHLTHGGGTLYADSPPLPPPPPPWKLAGKCRTMGAKSALRKFCLN